MIFDRSWYNRAGIERVMGFAPEKEVKRFLDSVPFIEQAMVRVGDPADQVLARGESGGADAPACRARINDPRKIWKLSDMDL